MATVNIFGKSIPAGLLVAMLVVAGAGAAAGVTMAGSIGGEMTTEVEQAIVVNASDPGEVIDKEGFVNVNDDGTEFRTAAQIWQGDDYDVEMNFSYQGQTDINAEMVLDIPKGLDVDVVPTNESGNVTVGQVSEDTWLLRINDEDTGTGNGHFDFELTFEIGTENDIEPGFYTVEGQLYPVEI